MVAWLIRWLLDFLGYTFGGADSGVPVGGRRGWLHLEGNGDQGWTARHSDKWYEPGGDPVRLTPEQARSLGLYAASGRKLRPMAGKSPSPMGSHGGAGEVDADDRRI